MIEGILQAVLDHWDDMPTDCSRPSGLDYWIDGTGAERVCAFLFPKGSAKPCLVVKVMRSWDGTRRLRREHRLVSRLREACPADVAGAIPSQTLVGGPHGPFVAEEYVEGTSLARIVSGRRDPADAVSTALRWLEDFSLAQKPRSGARATRSGRRLLERELATFESTFDLTPSEGEFLRSARDSAHEWLAHGVMLPVHGDFEPGNCLVGPRGGLGIIDWSFGRPMGLPAYDLLFFLVRLFIQAAGLKRLESESADYAHVLDAMLVADTWQNRLTREAMSRYWRRLSLPRAESWWVVATFLMVAANTYYAYWRERADWGCLFLPPSATDVPFEKALGKLPFAEMLRHLAAGHGRLAPQTLP